MFAPRSSATGKAAQPQPQSIEAVRRRARHRLIGAAVLVLIGVVGFPLLFDTEPRPISVDIPIEIPAKNATPALAASKKAVEAPPAAPSLSAVESLGAREEVVEPVRPEPQPAAKVEPRVEAKKADAPPPKAEAPAAPKPAAKPAPSADADRARALLEGKTPDKPAATGERLVVQVGAFAEASGAREVRQKLERAGLKTYTHVANTAEGQRIRVRVGPFASRAEAEKVAARVKALGLPAAILTL
ncbi:SPOR domain-containing protein [Hydrogenophaga sp.]|uniref:SPOR domain-containing protein n=1 Tax=Hydrogenophaga sp. TaxID=1904254 RepID=UPI002628F05A|nr:SPOR domain-containing protein [Hydrogenophaga sp.]MDM7950115.1 SPOR domain-containing protein [Hydrogenophaga sp.]